MFKELSKKKLDPVNGRIMKELIDEHTQARQCVRSLVEAKEKYFRGDKNSISEVVDRLKWLIEFYPVHIKKEDNAFFPNTEKYFTNEELDDMLKSFWEFDRKMIHEKYKNLVNKLNEKNIQYIGFI